jgi:uncharacterized protein YndB with AHSA1/START domain
MNTDRIEKQILLRAPRERVWRAIADSAQFGTWFGVEFDGPFVAGARVTGRVVKTRLDDEIACHQEPYVGMACDVWVEAIEPLRRLSFRWFPGAPEPGEEPGGPKTKVEFVLAEAAGGTLLTITESGFDQIPLARRARIFAENEAGWAMQSTLITKYLALQADG